MKKKRFFVLAALLALTAGLASAQTSKHYFDWYNGYNGWGYAAYLGTTKTCDPQKIADYMDQDMKQNGAAHGIKFLGYAQKLSKTEEWLVWQSLNEYNYSEGEVYNVVLQIDGEHRALGLVVVVTNGGNNFRWYGGWYTQASA